VAHEAVPRRDDPDRDARRLRRGSYALDTQDTALRNLATLDLATAVSRIEVPLWFVNGQWDQLRVNEALFRRLAPHAELIVVPRTTHLVTAMRPQIFNIVLRLAVATIESEATAAAADPAQAASRER